MLWCFKLTIQVFQELQSQLVKLTVIVEAESTVLTTCTTPYLMSNEEGGGLVFNKMTLVQATTGSSGLQLADIAQLQPDLFKQVIITLLSLAYMLIKEFYLYSTQ